MLPQFKKIKLFFIGRSEKNRKQNNLLYFFFSASPNSFKEGNI